MKNTADNNPVVAGPRACGTVLLPDVPTSKDAFNLPEQEQYGPHQTVAEAIADLISAPDAEGVSIGLEGSWGSGKTTVVNLLREELKGATDITLIPFDAWAHEGDPLRRTFLETTIRHLQHLGWVDERKWNETIEEIAKRRQVVETKDTPVFDHFAKAALLTPLLIPLGGALFGQALRENNITLDNTGDVAWKFIFELSFGLLLSFAPLVVLAFKKGRDAWGTLLTKGVLERRTEISNKTVNPTSIEFEDKFRELMKQALDDPSRRIVLVLDNLDRVDSKDALSMWSTLQTFLQHKPEGQRRAGDEQSPWHKRLWTLVLYDAKALRLLWEKRGDGRDKEAPPQHTGGDRAAAGGQSVAAGKDGEQNTEGRPAAGEGVVAKGNGAGSEARNGGGEIAASFIDKSFQIRFEVAPPLLSNWRDFLKECLKQAFPGHRQNNAELHRVYRVMFIDRVSTNRPAPTIRELKLYVNQIGALHRQIAARHRCGGAEGFTLPLLAYYVLLRRRDVDVVDGVLKKKLPEADFAALLGAHAGDKLAALFYNVKPSLARQIMLDDPVKRALQEKDKVGLLSYAGDPAAFWVVMEKIIDNEWLQGESASIARAAYCLDSDDLLKGANREVLEKFRALAGRVPSWSPLDDDRAEGIAALINIFKDREFTASLLDKIVGSLGEFEQSVRGLGPSGSEDDPQLPSDVRQWVERLKDKGVFARLDALGWPELYRERIIEPLSRKISGGVGLSNKSLSVTLEALCELGCPAPDADDSARRALGALVREGHLLRQLKPLGERDAASMAWA
ncbi:MAG: P-loop NTPase fold protein, partial [Pyrinomonadaceae bacterium]